MYAPPINALKAKRASKSAPSLASKAPQHRHLRPRLGSADQVLALQRTIGNQAVLRLRAQRAESVTENESADPAASKSMRSQPNRAEAELRRAPAIVHAVLHSPGRPLAPDVRVEMEGRFSEDFSHVRVHTDALAAESATAVDAIAYTVGNHIVFDEQRYAPSSDGSRSLLAHELAHVVQQGACPPSPDLAVDDKHEASAEAMAAAALGARTGGAEARARRSGPPGHSSPVVSRQAPATVRPAGPKEANIEVAWSDDDWEFEDRVVDAVARSRGFRGIPRSSLPFALNRPAAVLHEALYPRHFRPGHRIRVTVSANYDPDNIPSFTDVRAAIAESAPTGSTGGATTPGSTPAGTPAPPASHREAGPPSLKDQRDSLQRLYARVAADADRRGSSGITLEVSNNGKALSPDSMAILGPQVARPTTSVPLSEQAAARELESLMDAVIQSSGQWKATFARNATGAMHLKRWERLPDAPPPPVTPAAPAQARPRSASEEFEAETGVPDPRRINKALQNIAIAGLHEANPLSLKNMPYTIAGVVIPIGAMKLLTADYDALGSVVRFEWELDEEVVEASETEGLKTPTQPDPGTGSAPPPTRELKPGDVIPTRNMGQQRVVEIQPSGKIVTEPITATTGEDKVWVQLSDDSIRAYRPSEVQGPARPGQAASTPDGPGRVVSVGDPPQAGQVRQQPLKPLLSAEELNRPVPQVKGLSGPRRTLTSEERANANRIQAVLARLQKGDQAALNELAAFRAKPLTGELAGWTELDLLPGNPGGLNQMRMIVRVRPDGFIEARVIQMH